jgi:hypothetical protein
MWLYISGGFLSIVAHRHESDNLLVRARHPRHIQALLPDAEVFHLRDADYHFRAVVSRNDVQQALAGYMLTMDYDNYKNSIEDENFHGVCSDVWRTMWAYGRRYRNGGE